MGRGKEPIDTGDDDDEESEEESSELVGYLEDPPTAEERKLLTRRMFPSKVGGKPAWLVPKNLPELTCRKCERPLRFLLQVYASRGEDNAGAFHRVLKLFVCTSCQPNEVRAYRSQLPRENEFYSPKAPDQGHILATAHNDPELDEIVCWDCGLPCRTQPAPAAVADEDIEEVDTAGAVSNRCDECVRRLRNDDSAAVFQERELTCGEASEPEEEGEDMEDEAEAAAPEEAGEDAEVEAKAPSGKGKGYTTAAQPPAAPSQAPAEAPLAEAEATLKVASPAQDAGDAAMLEKLQEYRDMVAKDPEHALDRTEQKVFDEFSKKEGTKDDVFSNFQRFSDANETHVIRHQFGGKPLWFCTPCQPSEEPPACPACGGPRLFELQVQPQLIALLGQKGAPDSELARRLDFGVVCVFVCKNSCSPGIDTPYLEEFTYVQPEPQEAWLPK